MHNKFPTAESKSVRKALEQELRSYMLGLMNLGTLKFFEPTPAFLTWMATRFRGKRVYDVGAGHGHVTKALRARGVTTLPIDMAFRDNADAEPEIADATCYPYKPNTVVMICRPCHGHFTTDVIEQAIERKVSHIIYVGKVKNVSNDLDKFLPNFVPVLAKAGEDDEMVYEYKVKYAESKSR
jgi:hypothetical protein